MMSDKYNIMLSGVGGQGLMLLSEVIGKACNRVDKEVITGEQHGLSQRSGSIYVHLRIGEDAISPLVPYGEADVLISMEAIESLRYIEFLKDNGVVLTNERVLHHPVETSEVVDEDKEYVDFDDVLKGLKEVTDRINMIDSTGLAEDAGNPRTENVVLLGAVSALNEFPIDIDVLKNVVEDTVPSRAVNENLKAFELGYEKGKEFF